MRRPLSESRRELIFLLVLGLGSLLVHRLVWWLPIWLTLPLILVFTVEQSLAYLVVFAVVAELFSSLPVGVISLAVLLPWLSRKLFKKLEVDVSIRFLILVLVTTVIQMTIIFSGDLIAAESFASALLIVPWFKILTVSLLSSAVVFGVIVLTHYNKR